MVVPVGDGSGGGGRGMVGGEVELNASKATRP